MTDFYDESHRALQDEFESRALADRLENMIVKDHLDDTAMEMVERMAYCFLSTINGQGFPTTSFKGGDPGFVKMPDSKHLLIPCFDGNGMWRSAGNVQSQGKVGILFIDFESPQRLRIEGTAVLTRETAYLNQWPEVALVIEVSVTSAWVNCPRYIPTMTKVSASDDVPVSGVETQEPAWKKHEAFKDIVPARPHTIKS